jgi:hypothetical protein
VVRSRRPLTPAPGRPNWLVLVVSCRDLALLRPAADFKPHVVKLSSDGLAEFLARQGVPPAHARALLDGSEGSALWLALALAWIAAARRDASPGDLEALPRGLRRWYERAFDALKQAVGDQYDAVVATAVLVPRAQLPLNVWRRTRPGAQNEAKVAECLRGLVRGFEQGKLAVRHRSVVEWLDGPSSDASCARGMGRCGAVAAAAGEGQDSRAAGREALAVTVSSEHHVLLGEACMQIAQRCACVRGGCWRADALRQHLRAHAVPGLGAVPERAVRGAPRRLPLVPRRGLGAREAVVCAGALAPRRVPQG